MGCRVYIYWYGLFCGQIVFAYKIRKMGTGSYIYIYTYIYIYIYIYILTFLLVVHGWRIFEY